MQTVPSPQAPTPSCWHHWCQRLSVRLIPIAQNGRNLIGSLAFGEARLYGDAQLGEECHLLVAGGLSAPGRFGIREAFYPQAAGDILPQTLRIGQGQRLGHHGCTCLTLHLDDLPRLVAIGHQTQDAVLRTQREHPGTLARLHPAQLTACKEIDRGAAQPAFHGLLLFPLAALSLGHHLGDRLGVQVVGAASKEGGYGLERVTGTDPHDIEDETIAFARIGARAAPEHLLIQRPAAGGTRHDDAVHRGLIKAFGEHRTVGHHTRLARVQALQDGAALGKGRAAVQGFGRDTGRYKRSRPWHGPAPPWG